MTPYDVGKFNTVSDSRSGFLMFRASFQVPTCLCFDQWLLKWLVMQTAATSSADFRYSQGPNELTRCEATFRGTHLYPSILYMIVPLLTSCNAKADVKSSQVRSVSHANNLFGYEESTKWQLLYLEFCSVKYWAEDECYFSLGARWGTTRQPLIRLQLIKGRVSHQDDTKLPATQQHCYRLPSWIHIAMSFWHKTCLFLPRKFNLYDLLTVRLILTYIDNYTHLSHKYISI